VSLFKFHNIYYANKNSFINHDDLPVILQISVLKLSRCFGEFTSHNPMFPAIRRLHIWICASDDGKWVEYW
jgi:hypothetical protein